MSGLFGGGTTKVLKPPKIKIPEPEVVEIPRPIETPSLPATESAARKRALLLSRRRGRKGLSSLILTPLGGGGDSGPSTLGGA